jgi:hypothetical protein
MRNDLMNEIVEQLRLLTESSNRYIDDGSWIEPLTDDIRNSKALLKRYERASKALNLLASTPASESI